MQAPASYNLTQVLDARSRLPSGDIRPSEPNVETSGPAASPVPRGPDFEDS